MKKRKTAYQLWGRQCGDGWNGLVQPLHDDVLRLGGTVRQIKEKFGSLRFAYSLPKTIPEAERREFRQRVEAVEAASLGVCERCGRPGELINRKGYLFTACNACRDGRRPDR
jgi:hypothetical protein